MSNFTFQLESMSVDVSYTTLPEYDAFLADKILDGDATINIAVDAANMRSIFRFATDASDITDACDNDIKYSTYSSGWCKPAAAGGARGATLDFFGDDHAGDCSGVGGTIIDISACTDGENTNFTLNQNGAGEFVRHLASEITGGYGSSDIFSNEAALLSAVKALKTTVHDLIKHFRHALNPSSRKGATDRRRFRRCTAALFL